MFELNPIIYCSLGLNVPFKMVVMVTYYFTNKSTHLGLCFSNLLIHALVGVAVMSDEVKLALLSKSATEQNSTTTKVRFLSKLYDH